MEKNTNFTIIYFIRHGQSLGNANLTFLGHTDLDLSELGYAQARATADFLSKKQIDLIFSSDLCRAYNTAAPHAFLRGLEVFGRAGLREAFVGEWEGLTTAEIEEKYGDLYRVDWRNRFGVFSFPGGESIIGAGERFYKEMLGICVENPGKSILVATHAAVLRSFWAKISGIAPQEIAEKLPFPSNASVSVAEFDGERFVPLEYSLDSHLSEVGITRVKL